MTNRHLCEFFLVAGQDGFEVADDLDTAIEQYSENVTQYGQRRIFKLSVLVPIDEQITEATTALPDDAQGGAFKMEVKPASE